MKTSARFQLPARLFFLILFCVHAALYVVQLGDYCHRGKNRDQIADSLGSQISTTTTSCVLFLVPRRRDVFFSRLYIAEVTPIHLKETSIIQAGETDRVLYTQLDTRYSSAAVRLFTAGENTIAAAALRQRLLVL
jgi:hypothetical protein